MIYLITGVPGSGKTLYAVSTLVQKLAAEKITDKDGEETARRVVVDGIPDLVMPHEMMAQHDEALDGKNVRGEGDGLWNWNMWCKPGDVLVVDEVQRHWRPRGMGTKPPEEIKALETHRHKGVDFVIVTQNPMLIDQNVRRLVGRHIHIRRMFGMARCVVYDWDGCSVDVHRTKSATTSFWSYPKSAYKLYKSSELHTKQKQKVPFWLVVPIMAVVGGLAVAPTAFGVMNGAMTGKGISAKAQEQPKTAIAETQAVPVEATPSETQAVAPEPIPVAAVVPAGCIVVRDRCGCFDVGGIKVEVEPAQCKELAGVNGTPKALIEPEFKPRPIDDAEREALAFAFGKH